VSGLRTLRLDGLRTVIGIAPERLENIRGIGKNETGKTKSFPASEDDQ